jgi:hypothetical protein
MTHIIDTTAPGNGGPRKNLTDETGDVRTNYARAVAGYDVDFEHALADVIADAIARASIVSDCSAMVVRTGETAEALLGVLASVLALSPEVTRSPTIVRATVDDFSKKLRRKVTAAAADPAVREFSQRAFHGAEAEGSA